MTKSSPWAIKAEAAGRTVSFTVDIETLEEPCGLPTRAGPCDLPTAYHPDYPNGSCLFHVLIPIRNPLGIYEGHK